jgi:hypothetical protein
MKGMKTGGRQKGVPNKRNNLSVSKFLSDKGVVPVEEIWKLMPELKPEEQAKVWLKLQEYIEPKATVPLTPDDNPARDLSRIPTAELISIVKNDHKP